MLVGESKEDAEESFIPASSTSSVTVLLFNDSLFS